MCTDFNFVWYYVIFQVNIMGEEVDLLLKVSEHFPCLFTHGSKTILPSNISRIYEIDLCKVDVKKTITISCCLLC